MDAGRKGENLAEISSMQEVQPIGEHVLSVADEYKHNSARWIEIELF